MQAAALERGKVCRQTFRGLTEGCKENTTHTYTSIQKAIQKKPLEREANPSLLVASFCTHLPESNIVIFKRVLVSQHMN